MNILISLVILYINTTRKHDMNYDIALYIVKNYYRIEEVNIKELLEKCYTSRNTITKFCEMFGYSSWTFFKERLVQTKQIKQEQINQRLAGIDIEDYYHKFMHLTQSQNHTQYIDQMRRTILKIVDHLHESNRMFLFGAVTPLSLAVEFQTNMISLSKLVFVDYETEIDTVPPLDEKDIAIIFSATGRFVREHTYKFFQVYHSKATKGLITLSSQFECMDGFDYYFHLYKTNDVSDFNWYIIMLLDLIFIEYYDKYVREDS